ncbi:MAG: zf-HC2 domain-containing protein [Candidatus Omnitrophota bacterium]
MSNWEEETKIPLITSCKQAARLVSIAIERRLTVRETLTMNIHLWMCKTCTRYRNQIRLLRQAFTRHEEALGNTPASECDCLNAQSKQRIKDALAKSR